MIVHIAKVFESFHPLDLAHVAEVFKQRLERFLVALAVVKAGNTSENLLNEILQIIYSLYRATVIKKYVRIQ